MGFADWKKRSTLYQSFKSRAVRFGIAYDEVARAAYKAGEREDRKQVEAITENCVGLAVLAEREACANVCEEKHVNGNWKHDTRHECAEAIRMRANERNSGVAEGGPVMDVDLKDGQGTVSIVVLDVMSQIRIRDYFKLAERLADDVDLLRAQRDAWKAEAEHQYGLVRGLKFEEADYPVTGALDEYAARKYKALRS